MQRGWVLALALAVVSFVSDNEAQQPGRSEAELRIELERAELDETVARESLHRKDVLAKEGLISDAEVRAAAAEVRRAELNTLRSRISLMNELPSFRIIAATKLVGADGQMRVELDLLPLSHAYGEVSREYLVSLRGPTSIISEPYQATVTVRGDRAVRQRLSFRLLKDVDEIVILITSGTRREEVPVLLQRSRHDRRISLRAQNFSQEATLGDRADYALDIERFSPGARDVRLVVVGLPPEMTHEWVDATTNAKLSSFRFASDQTSARLLLRVYLPPQGVPAWLGRIVNFRAEIVDAGAVVGAVDLQLRPVGAPKLFITSDNLLIHARPDDRKLVSVTVENGGGVAARDVKPVAAVPIGFDVSFDPPSVNVLAPGTKARFVLRLVSLPDAIPGEYSMKVRAEASTKLANIESPEQSFRIVLSDGGRWLPIAAVIVLLILGAGVSGWLWLRRHHSTR